MYLFTCCLSAPSPPSVYGTRIPRLLRPLSSSDAFSIKMLGENRRQAKRRSYCSSSVSHTLSLFPSLGDISEVLCDFHHPNASCNSPCSTTATPEAATLPVYSQMLIMSPPPFCSPSPSCGSSFQQLISSGSACNLLFAAPGFQHLCILEPVLNPLCLIYLVWLLFS